MLFDFQLACAYILWDLELELTWYVQRGWLEMNHSLCWLGLAKNRLRRLTHLQNLSSLAVLDISDNKVARCNATTCQDMPRHALNCQFVLLHSSCSGAFACVLDKDRNCMEFLLLRLDGLQNLQALKALIAARNRITLLDGISPKKNPLLETIVLSHNQLQSVSLAGGCQDVPIISC